MGGHSKLPPSKQPKAGAKPGSRLRRDPSKPSKATKSQPGHSDQNPQRPGAVGLTPRQQRFVDAYALLLNATQAAIAAGFAVGSARHTGSRLTTKVHIRAAIDARLKAIHDQFEIDQVEVLKAYHAIAFTDANQLVEFRRQSCRYCWGEDNRYQLTKNEMLRHDTIVDQQAEDPTDKTLKLPIEWMNHGGSGYDRRKEPNKDCCECFGEGEGITHIHDTRKLSKEARHLYAGMEETKDGLKVRMKSADRALDTLAKHKGLFVETVKFDFTEVPTEKLDAIHEKAMALAAEKQQAIAGRAKRLGLKLSSAGEY